MLGIGKGRKLLALGLLIIVGSLMAAPLALAVEGAVESHGPASVGDGLKAIGAGLGVGLAVGLAGLGTGIAQSRIGAAGAGTIAENPKLFILMLILVALPETVIILGFVISFLALGKF